MRIYLAAPYSHSDPAVRQARFALVNKVAAELMLLGHEVFSPISMGHVICEAGSLPTVFSFWRPNCLSFLRSWATHLLILKLEGWETSEGVGEEYAQAEHLGLGIITKNLSELVGVASDPLPGTVANSSHEGHFIN